MTTTTNSIAEPARAATAAGATPARRLAAFARRRWEAYWEERARRTVVRMLQALDDRTLNDIGLKRSEIWRAVYRDHTRPPTRRGRTP